jgi:hypothetical protein
VFSVRGESVFYGLLPVEIEQDQQPVQPVACELISKDPFTKINAAS